MVMFKLRDIDKGIIAIFIFLLCLIGGFYFAKIYQPEAKTVKIYKQALKDYENGNYSNSYFLFSKISHLSDLKPAAVYRQAMCAKILGDRPSELHRYQQLFKNYPNNKLSMEAKYNAAQLLVEEEPNLALRYFNDVIKSNISEDYKIASEYYKARIKASKLKYSKKVLSKKKIDEIEVAFRNYLEKYPNGRLAPSVASTWKKFNSNLQESDLILIIRAYYLGGMYNEAKALFKQSKLEDNWALQVSTAYETRDYQSAFNLAREGVEKYSESVSVEDYNRAVDSYLSMFDQNRQLQSDYF